MNSPRDRATLPRFTRHAIIIINDIKVHTHLWVGH